MRIALALLLITLPLAAAKKPSVSQLEAQIRRLTEERDGLKQRLAATGDLQQELLTAQAARDQAKAEAEAAQHEVEQVRAVLQENQGSGDAILKELQAAKQEAQEARADSERLKGINEALRKQVEATPTEGDLVVLGENILPARPLNLNRVTPRLKSASLFASRPKGVVVVNVLISEKGEVLAARLVQGLPGDGAEIQDASEACVEAAKKVVFDPASAKDGKTHFKVWQGVGFYLD